MFFCYGLLGWVLETAYAALRQRRYVDRSVLFGPLCLSYGLTGAVLTWGLWELRGRYFFLFLGCWWLADALMPQLLLFEGIPGVILRVVTVVVLILLCRVMLQERQKSKEIDRQKKQQSSKNGGKGEKS